MSEFKSYKKADLAKVARKIGVSVRAKDTKQSLLEKVERILEQSPEKARVLASLDSVDDDSLEVVTLVEEGDATEDESEDSSESGESSEDSETVAVKSAADSAQTDVAEEDDEADKDYDAPPPVDFKEWLVDPAIAAYETVHDRVLQFTDAIGATTLECNSDLRETLSTTVTLNFLEAALEAAHYLYFYVPLVPLKDNKAVHQVFFDNIPQLNTCTWSSPDVSALANFSVASILGNWALYAVAVPLLISYYVNFSRRVVQFEADEEIESDEEEEIDENEIDEEGNLVETEDFEDYAEDFSVVVRAYRFDPFIFALSKVLIYYFIHKNGALTGLASYAGVLNALKNLVFIQLGIYHTFVVSLGNFPLVIGLANVAIALYAQFEDY